MTAVHVQGLNPMLLDFIKLHQTPAYDIVILRMWAQCLAAAGYRRVRHLDALKLSRPADHSWPDPCAVLQGPVSQPAAQAAPGDNPAEVS